MAKNMSLKKEYTNTLEIVKVVLRNRKYKIISLVFSIVSFAVLYYLLVAKTAENSIRISVIMSGAGFVTFSIVAILITASLSGILFSMLIFKISLDNKIEGKGIFGFIGSGIAAFGVGCPTCGALLFGLIGLPLALMYLPFRGLELQVLGIFILALSIYFTGKSIKGICKV